MRREVARKVAIYMNKYKIRRKIINKIFKTEHCWGVFVKNIITDNGQKFTRLIYQKCGDTSRYVIDFKCTKNKLYALLGRNLNMVESDQVDFLREYDNLVEILLDIHDIERICYSRKKVLKTDEIYLLNAKYISRNGHDNRQFLKYQLSCLSPISFIKSLWFDI